MMDSSTRLTSLERWLIALPLAAGIVFGLFPLLAPQQFAALTGFPGNDPFIYRLAGAATLGYAVMGIFEIRSRNWHELRCPFVMAAIFNGLSFLASLLAIALGEPLLLPVLVAIASLAVTIATIVALRTNRGTSTAALATPLARP